MFGLDMRQTRKILMVLLLALGATQIPTVGPLVQNVLAYGKGALTVGLGIGLLALYAVYEMYNRRL